MTATNYGKDVWDYDDTYFVENIGQLQAKNQFIR